MDLEECPHLPVFHKIKDEISLMWLLLENHRLHLAFIQNHRPVAKEAVLHIEPLVVGEPVVDGVIAIHHLDDNRLVLAKGLDKIPIQGRNPYPLPARPAPDHRVIVMGDHTGEVRPDNGHHARACEPVYRHNSTGIPQSVNEIQKKWLSATDYCFHE